jgi:hypothetical protein
MGAETAFIETLRQLLSNENSVRGEAEKLLEDAKKQQPAHTLSQLFLALGQTQVEEAVREQAAVLLRQALGKISDANSTWSVLDQNAHEDCKVRLLALLENEASEKVRRKIADCIQSLGNQLVTIDGDARPNNIEVWPALMPALMRLIMDASRSTGLRADSLFAVRELQCSIWQVMIANSSQTGQVLSSCLADANEDIRANAAMLLVEMLDYVEGKAERQPFIVLFPSFCEALQIVARSQDSKNFNDVLQRIGTAESGLLDFLNSGDGSLTTFAQIMSTVAKGHAEESIQRLCLETLINFVDHKPKAASKNQALIQTILDVSVSFMMQLDDDMAAWSSNDPEDDEEDNFACGREIVDRLSRAMARKELFPQVMELMKPALQQLFSTGDWKHSVAGITILAQIAEFVDDEATVHQMLPGILQQISATNPRVRSAAWSAIAQFSEDHTEIVTGEAFAPQILNLYMLGLDDQNTRVLVRCMESFQHFGESVDRELMDPFLQTLMEKIGRFLQVDNLKLQKTSITFIAVIAGQVEDAFAPYYAPLMPLFKGLIQKVLHKTEERELLGKCFECISLLAKAVGPAGFRADAQVIMEFMVQATQVPNLPSNDPVKEYMMAASERIASTLKADFLPFVPHVLPMILEKFTLAPKEYTQEGLNEFNEEEEVNLTLVEENGKVKVLIMSTSDMEDLKNAMVCVHTYIEELGKHYAPFVQKTAQALLPVFEFNMSEEHRSLAFETWGQLCVAAREGQPALLPEMVQGFLGLVVPKLIKYDQLDVEALKTKADGVKICVKEAGPGILSKAQVDEINKVSFQVLSESFARRQAALADKKKPQAADDEDDDGEERVDEYEESLRINCCEISGALMENYTEFYAESQIAPTMELLTTLFSCSDKKDNKLGLFVACDMVKFLQQRVTAHWPKFMPAMLNCATHPDPDLRQPALYGLSQAAKNPAFAEVAVDTAGKMISVIQQSRSRAKKKSEKHSQACADNALSALLEIMQNHQAVLAGKEAPMWDAWLLGLPCQEDEEEGIKNHKVLLELAQSQSDKIQAANWPHVLSVLVDVYKTSVADEDTSKGIGLLVKKLGSDGNAEQLSAKLSEKQKKKMMRIFREATQNA